MPHDDEKRSGKRSSWPAIQSRPSPNGKPPPAAASAPWISIIGPIGGSPITVNRTRSSVKLALPIALNNAPFDVAEFAHPAPVAPVLPHGQGGPLPSPLHSNVPGKNNFAENPSLKPSGS